MSNIAQAIQHLFPASVPLRDWVVSNPGSGQVLTFWSAALGPQPSPAQIDAAMLPATKAARIEADRKECRRRLTAHYGDALEQGSRIAGDYGEAARVNRSTGVQATVDASNAARDTINLLATDTVAKVEAVTVAWPVLT